MYFCGDVAVSGFYNNLNYEFDFSQNNQPVFINLEGPLCNDEKAPKLRNKRKVYNTEKVTELLVKNRVTGCILANNHITDFQDNGLTRKTLHCLQIQMTGYGNNFEDAAKPILVHEDGEEYAIVAFGWNTIGCKYVSKNGGGINPLKKETVIQQIRNLNKSICHIIVFFHWDYEYELYPMPMQREIAKAAIDNGAELVIGCHPHCVQGIEFYKGSPIVYSLGNWMFDSFVYFGGKLETKQYGREELVIQWKDKVLTCHWYEYNKEKSLPVYKGSELAKESDKIHLLTPFAEMTESDYIKWFKINRRIHKALPVFQRPEDVLRNSVYHCYILLREKVARTIKEGIKCLIRSWFI